MNPIRQTAHPLLLQISVRPWLTALSRDSGRPVTLGTVPDELLAQIRDRGFHAVWLMGVWPTGASARALALRIPELLREYEHLIPDWNPQDVPGSPYSVAAYEPSPSVGTDRELSKFRKRLNKHGLGLILDFVPNHVGRDHPWLDAHPRRLVRGTARDLAKAPDDWFVHTGADGNDEIFAFGRDPYFPGWSDTVQIDYRRSETRTAMKKLLRKLAGKCDGLRCDMAMLLLPDVFERTWGPPDAPWSFWDEAISHARETHPDTVFLAEVYWDREDELHALGFDYCYDKTLYDRVRDRDTDGVRGLLDIGFDRRKARANFLENHDEPRSRATFDAHWRAAAAITFGLPGMRFFQAGQADGRRVRIPVQLGRDPVEEIDPETALFYETLEEFLRDPVVHDGEWSSLRSTVLEEANGGIQGSVWQAGCELRIFAGNLWESAERASLRLPPDAPQVWIDVIRGVRFESYLNEAGQHVLQLNVDANDAVLVRPSA